MEAIILAGGLGTRLRELVPHLPKPMAPVAGRPFLEILLYSLIRNGFKRIIISLGYLADMVVRYFGNEYLGVELKYVVEEEPLGTGGAVLLSMTHLREDHVYVINGDTWQDLDISAIENLWQTQRAPIIVARRVADTSRYGRLSVHEGHVTGFSEKGTRGPGLINTGCYVFNAGQLSSFPAGARFSLENDYLAWAVNASRFEVFTDSGFFIDIGVPEDYHRAQNELSGILGQLPVCII